MLIKHSLAGVLSERTHYAIQPTTHVKRVLQAALRSLGFELYRSKPVNREQITDGRAWAEEGLTMIGLARLDNIERCVTDTIDNEVPGDLIETGAWRGGATIFMRAVLATHGVTDRTVFVADSFQGLPTPSHAADQGDQLHTMDLFSVSVEMVKANFERYGLLDGQVRFVEGYFRDTLPALRDNRWAVIRLDGDLYESTMDALTNLYPGLSPGGWLIVDDYGHLPACAQAVDDFRRREGITEPIEQIDWSGICWQHR